MPSAVRLVIFAKAPVPGRVKTRLNTCLGADGAVRLHQAMTWRAVTEALALELGEVELWCAPGCSHPFFARCRRELGVRLRPQPAGDLGQRMDRATRAALARGDGPVLLMGADAPSLSATVLRRALAELQDGMDAVFAVADDGGYCLVGLNAPQPMLFRHIPWGGVRVMDATRRQLRRLGLRWRELEGHWDVDRPEDLHRLRRSGMYPLPF